MFNAKDKGAWSEALLQRCPANVAIVVMANRWHERRGRFWRTIESTKRVICAKCPHNKVQRVRLDCDREASHNLNRLLDKPGGAAMILLVMEISL